jgi:hypothetical protein
MTAGFYTIGHLLTIRGKVLGAFTNADDLLDHLSKAHDRVAAAK